jgi:hypothetical protein
MTNSNWKHCMNAARRERLTFPFAFFVCSGLPMFLNRLRVKDLTHQPAPVAARSAG